MSDFDTAAAAADHPAVDDLGAIGVVGPARAGRHDVAMGVEGDRRAALPEAAPDDQIGRRDHAIGFDQAIGNLVPLDREPETLEEPGDRGGGKVAVAGRIVGRNLYDLGQEARLRVGMRLNEGMDRAFGPPSSCSPQIDPSGVESLDAQPVKGRRHMRGQARAQSLVIEVGVQVGQDRAARAHRFDLRRARRRG